MELTRIEDQLNRTLSIHSVHKLDAFPCETYTEFVALLRNGQLRLLTRYNVDVMATLGTTGERMLHYMLTWFPFVVGLSLIALSLLWWNAWLLCGLPLAILGFFISNPGLMDRIGWVLLVIAAGGGIIAGFLTAYVFAIVCAAYVLSNIAVLAARFQCGQVIHRAVCMSEVVLVWLYLRGAVLLEQDGRLQY